MPSSAIPIVGCVCVLSNNVPTTGGVYLTTHWTLQTCIQQKHAYHQLCIFCTAISSVRSAIPVLPLEACAEQYQFYYWKHELGNTSFTTGSMRSAISVLPLEACAEQHQVYLWKRTLSNTSCTTGSMRSAISVLLLEACAQQCCAYHFQSNFLACSENSFLCSCQHYFRYLQHNF